VPASLEISRSGNGAHAWIFFTTAVPTRIDIAEAIRRLREVLDL